MDIAILLFDRLTALDAVGPYEVLSRLPDANLTFVATDGLRIAKDGSDLRLVFRGPTEQLSDGQLVVTYQADVR